MRSTHTVATLAVSFDTYTEIDKALTKAGYTHAFIETSDGVMIDMAGIGLTANVTQADGPSPLETLERIANWLETSKGKLSRQQITEMVALARAVHPGSPEGATS